MGEEDWCDLRSTGSVCLTVLNIIPVSSGSSGVITVLNGDEQAVAVAVAIGLAAVTAELAIVTADGDENVVKCTG